jgi:hypothetical protein
MAKTKTIRVSDEELAALKEYRRQQGEQVAQTDEEVKEAVATDAQKALANAFVEAIERTRPPEKAKAGFRKKKTPWSPPEGEPRLKMRRVFHQHGIPLGENVSNETIALLNKIKPGRYCDGNVIVTLRKDQGIDISYPVRTASQRLRMVNAYGIRGFDELLQRIIDERSNPAKYRKAEDADLFDLDS